MKPNVFSEAHAAYLKALRRKNRLVVLARIGVLILFLLLWELGAALRWFDPFILSSPSRVIAAIGRLVRDGSLWVHVGTTLLETVLGFLLGTALGAAIAAAVARMAPEGKRYALKSVSRKDAGGRSAWAAAGIADNTRPF